MKMNNINTKLCSCILIIGIAIYFADAKTRLPELNSADVRTKVISESLRNSSTLRHSHLQRSRNYPRFRRQAVYQYYSPYQRVGSYYADGTPIRLHSDRQINCNRRRIYYPCPCRYSYSCPYSCPCRIPTSAPIIVPDTPRRTSLKTTEALRTTKKKPSTTSRKPITTSTKPPTTSRKTTTAPTIMSTKKGANSITIILMSKQNT